MGTTVLNLPDEEYMLSGNRACPGCGLAIAFRYILKALDGEAVFAVPACCLTVLGGMYPNSSARVPWMNVVFPGTAAAATGLAAGLKAVGKENVTVVGMAGDGGTNDIGIQGLSGAAERNANFIYICYDNEAYMNTGTQRSSATSLGARTTTSPVSGKPQPAKDMPRIMEAHGVPYIASACSSFPIDLYDKVRKAKRASGTRYIHVTAPCPPGWTFQTRDTVRIGELAVETGAVVLYEIEHGEFRLTSRSKAIAKDGALKPLHEYFELQGRFAQTAPAILDEFQAAVTARWNEYVKRAAE